MSSGARHALLFGATGLVGGKLLQQLLENEGFSRVTAVTRKPLQVTHGKLINIVNDFGRSDPPPELVTADVAYSCLGTTLKQAGGKAGFYAVDHDLCVRCAQWGRRRGVPHFVMVSAMGASVSSPVYYSRVKAEAENDIEALGFPRLTFIQPSLLLGDRGGAFRPGEALAIRLSPLIGPLMRGPLSPYTPVDAGDVASAMLACGLQPSGPALERLRWREIMTLAGKR